MNSGNILVFDSGIGGLTVLSELTKILKCERYLYFGDNKNAPYGSKSKAELTSILKKNCEYFKVFSPKLLVCACNTLSADFLDVIENATGVKTLGVFPPVEAKRGKTLLIATERTCRKYRGIEGVDLAPMKYLARDIEKNALSLEKIDLNYHLFSCRAPFHREKGYYDTVILGCTHYLFVKNQIVDHFCPKYATDGGIACAKSVVSYLKSINSLGNYKTFSIDFIGETADFNKKAYEKLIKRL